MIPVCGSSFPCLETLHIIHCGDLVHVFEPNRWYSEDIMSRIGFTPLYDKEIISVGVLFPKLKTIHLHDLPKLRQICEVKMVAPALESIKIRGCWGLRRLPSVGASAHGEKKPTVEIEKDVWDALECGMPATTGTTSRSRSTRATTRTNCPGYPSSGTMILLNPTLLV
jgi:hypothetical protein